MVDSFDIEAYFIADTFEAHLLEWLKRMKMVSAAILLLSDNPETDYKQQFQDLRRISKLIREEKKEEALDWIENGLPPNLQSEVTSDVYEYLRR